MPTIWLSRWLHDRNYARDKFLYHHKIEQLWQQLSLAADTALTHSFTPFAQEACLIAAGSYGKRELLPHSDIDLLILTGPTPPEGLHAWVADLWRSGLRIGHSVHQAESAIAAMKNDIVTFHNFSQARVICGNKALYNRFMRQRLKLIKTKGISHFIDQLLAAREARHARFGDSRFFLEPQVKEGKNAARDAELISSLYYLAFSARDVSRAEMDALIPKESALALKKAKRFFARTRAMLHVHHNHAREHLTFEAQLSLANMLRYKGKTAEAKAQAFMSDYFHHTRVVTANMRECCVLLDRFGKRTPPFRLADRLSNLPSGLEWRDGRVAFSQHHITPETGLRMLAAFAASAQYKRDLHPYSYHFLTSHQSTIQQQCSTQPNTLRAFLDLLLQVDAASVLRRMQDAAMLSAIIPAFAQVTGQMQYDGYHTLTVDAHIIKVIENLHHLRAGHMQSSASLASKVMQEVPHEHPLYLAALCHDLAKGTGGAHAEKGSTIAENLAQMAQLGTAKSALIGWLVTHHQLLSETAFKRDIHDDETIESLVQIVQSPERLKLLFLLTVADMMSVGPNIWNNWKASIMETLFIHAMRHMGVEMAPSTAPDTHQPSLNSAQKHAIQSGEIAAEWHINHAHATTEVALCMPYDKSMLKHAAGILSYFGANIVSARTIHLDDGLCRLIFSLQNGQGRAFAETQRLEKLAPYMQQGGIATDILKATLPARGYWQSNSHRLAIPPQIFFDQHFSATATIVEVNAKDRPALLYTVLDVFDVAHMHVSHAYVATYGQKAVDVFYVRDRFGFKLTPSLERSLEAQLLTALHHE